MGQKASETLLCLLGRVGAVARPAGVAHPA